MREIRFRVNDQLKYTNGVEVFKLPTSIGMKYSSCYDNRKLIFWRQRSALMRLFDRRCCARVLSPPARRCQLGLICHVIARSIPAALGSSLPHDAVCARLFSPGTLCLPPSLQTKHQLRNRFSRTFKASISQFISDEIHRKTKPIRYSSE